MMWKLNLVELIVQLVPEFVLLADFVIGCDFLGVGHER